MEFVRQGKILESELKIINKEISKFRNKSVQAEIYVETKGSSINSDSRSGRVYFTSPQESKNIYQILQSTVIESYHNFNFNFFNISSIQYAYYGTNDHFDWHNDVIRVPGFDMYRSFTMSVNITPPEQYTGGELLVKHEKHIIELSKEPGSFIIFPSFLTHKASKVLSGIRESIVVWVQSSMDDLKDLERMYAAQYVTKNSKV